LGDPGVDGKETSQEISLNLEADISHLYPQVPTTYQYYDPVHSTPYPTNHIMDIHLNPYSANVENMVSS